MRRALILGAFTVFLFLETRGNGEGNNVEYRPGVPKLQKVWNTFYSGDHEPELDDPLIKAGKKMTSAICAAIVHPDMKYRRYAIGALGFIADVQSIPTLESILKDEREEDYFRGDALRAIYQINESLGTKYARQHSHRRDYLKLISDAILKKEPWLKEPTEE